MTDRHDDPVIRLATVDDAPGMVRVLETAFDRWPPFEIDVPAVDHLRWKMSTPGLPAAHTVAVIDGQVAAVTVRWVSQVRLGDSRLVQDSSVDHAVHPDVQGRRLGSGIGRFAHAQAVAYSDLSLGTGISHERIPGIFDQFDPPQVEHVLSMRSRPFGPRAFVAAHRSRGGAVGVARQGLRAARGLVRSRGPASGARIEELTSFDERVDPLWEAFASRFDFAVERSVEYLNWRYCDPAGGRAVALAAFEGDRMVGYAVFKRSDDWSNVLDLAVQPEQPRASMVVRELLDAGCRRMADAGARGAHVALTAGHPLGRMVEAAGFLALGWSTHFSSGPQRRGYSSPILDRFYAGQARNHLMLGDSDIY